MIRLKNKNVIIKYLILVFAFAITITDLQASKLYFDAGMGVDYTRLSFKKDEYSYRIRGLWDAHYNSTLPNYFFKIGYRLGEERNVIIVLDIQNINLDVDVHYIVSYGNNTLLWSGDWTYDQKILPHQYRGIGFIYYPHPNIQTSFTRGFVDGAFERKRYGSEKALKEDILPLNNSFSASIAYDYAINNIIGFTVGYRLFYTKSAGGLRILISDPPKYNIISNGLFITLRF
jgi:hypothetical protein